MNPLNVVKSGIAHLRMAQSIFTGSAIHLPSLAHLVRVGVVGSPSPDANSSRAGRPDPKMVKWAQDRRIRQVVKLAAQDTEYYFRLFGRNGHNGQTFTADQFFELPITTKEALRDRPEAFVRRGFRPTLQTMTTGSTGRGTATLFTLRETQIFSLMSAMGLRRKGDISSADIVQVNTSARALLGNQTAMDALRHLDALVYQAGIVDPAQSLALLTQKHYLPDRKEQVSVLFTYPSYLGKLLEVGLDSGYGPQDFGLERIIVGGEVSSPGLRQRSEALFGQLPFDESYGISEAWPFRGSYCEEGHLHFDPLRGLMEVLDLESDQPARPGEAGSLVLTPFLPFRESSIILRYDTGDMVRTLVDAPTCSLSNIPATGPLLGKRRSCVRTESGWFGPRDILEILEPNMAVPLPVRFGLWAEAGSLGLEVAVRETKPTLRQQIAEQLQSAGIPVTTLQLVNDPAQLECPLPWRGDLHEYGFSH